MRYAILGDIHGNYDALLAVKDQLDREDVDEILCVGDIVGYGAQPRECIALVRELCSLTIAGNHDYASVGKLGAEYFNDYARAAIEWTSEHLSEEDCRYLSELELVDERDGFSIVHSSYYQPQQFGYVFSPIHAFVSFQYQEAQLGFYGHTHLPRAFFNHLSREPLVGREEMGAFSVDADVKALVNVGSVGQPRDHDTRAAFVVYDTEEKLVSLRSVEYNFTAASDKIRAAGLPDFLADRLLVGR